MREEVTLEEIYGVDIGEYCRLHGIAVDQLIKKTMIDIEILLENYARLEREKFQHDLDSKFFKIISSTQKLIDKKRKHLARLQKWAEKETYGNV